MLSETGTIMQNTCEYKLGASPTEALSETGTIMQNTDSIPSAAD